MSQVLEQAGIVALKNSGLSERLCKPCATKVRKTCEGLQFIVSTLNVVNPKIAVVNTHDEPEVEVTAELQPRSKRSLPTSISTPDRSPGAKKLQKVSSDDQRSSSENADYHRPRVGVSARKSLGLQFQADVVASQDDNEDGLLNINDIIDPELQSTRIKSLILWPSGRTDVRSPEERDDILLIKNIALKNWQAVANAVLKHENLKAEILKALWRALNVEFRQYCSFKSVLKGCSPEELIAFTNKLVIEEIVKNCPFWSSCIGGACSVVLSETGDLQDSVKNSVAIATSVTARVRNKCMSAAAYRISSILFHSGVSTQDLVRLNRLGICMSPDMTLSLQRSLGKNFDAKVKSYKKALEEKPADTLALFMEIEEKQVPAADGMETEVLLDLREESLRDYKHFTPHAFSTVTKMLQAEKEERNCSIISSDVLKQVILNHKKFNFPFFK